MAYNWNSLRQGRYTDDDERPVGGTQATNIQTAGQNVPLGVNRGGYGPRSTASVPNQRSTGAQPPPVGPGQGNPGQQQPPVPGTPAGPSHPLYNNYQRQVSRGKFTGTFEEFLAQRGAGRRGLTWAGQLGNALIPPSEPRPNTYQRQRGLRPNGGGGRYVASGGAAGAPDWSSPL